MSFNFGAASPPAANTFGAPAASTGFAFGSGDTSKNLFGGATAAAPAAEVKPFSFTSPTTNAPTMGTMGSGAFSFGAKTAPAATGLFGSPQPATQPTATAAVSPFGASKPLSFGAFSSPPNQTVGSPGFGQPAAQSNLFGTPTNPPAFGSPATQPSTGIAFGTSTPAAAPAFGASSAPSTGFSAFGSPSSGFAAPQATTMGGLQSQAQNTLSAGPSVFSTPTPAGFGQMAQQPATAAASNFSFGPPSSGTGLSFGTSQPQTAQAAAQPSLSFGTSQPQQTGLSLGQQQQKPATSQPALSFGQTSQPLGFGQTAVSQPAGIGQLTGLGQPSGLGQTFGTPPASQSFGLASTAAPVSQSFGLTSNAPVSQSFGLSSTAAPVSQSFGLASTAPASQSFGLSSTAAPVSQSFGLASTAPASQSFGLASTAAPVSQTGGLPSFSQPSGQTAASVSGGISFASSLPSTGGISLGTMAAPTPTSVPLSMAPTQPASTGFSLAQPTASTAAPISTSAPAPVSSGLGFGSTGISLGGSLATTTSTAGFGTLGQKPATTMGFGLSTSTQPSSLAATTASAVTSLPSLAKTTTAPTTLPTLTTATSTAPPAVPQAIASINFAELEENINKWTLELETQERTFIGQATQINAWGTLLVSNGEKIVELNDAVQTVKNEQQSLEHELDFVLCQQRELEDLLAPLEKQLCDDGDTVRDPQREHMYSLAENLDSQLRQMSEDLKEVIEHLNETNRSQDSSDPIVQIGRILNVHMSSMQWIDNSIAQISTKLDQLRATHDTLRRDNEKSFHLTYN